MPDSHHWHLPSSKLSFDVLVELSLPCELVLALSPSVDARRLLVVEPSSEALYPGSGSRVQVHCRRRFRRPAIGVSGHESLSDSEEESLFDAKWVVGERSTFCGLLKRADKRGLRRRGLQDEGEIELEVAVAVEENRNVV
jgi:hypothetical protein